MKKLLKLELLLILCLGSQLSLAKVDFKSEFGQRDVCFIIANIKTGKVIKEYNANRCAKQFSPCSTFKIAAALMAFESGALKDENQVIKWDGVKRDRAEINRDQTPFTWMTNSTVWVTQALTPQVGMKAIQNFLEQFSYGNKDFSGGLDQAWLTSSLKISAHEQLKFLSQLWKNSLPISKRSMDLTKKIIFIKKLGKNSELFGKTGTGCIAESCVKNPDRNIGWFIGVLKSGENEYAFVANATDLIKQEKPAGPRLRETIISTLEKMDLVK